MRHGIKKKKLLLWIIFASLAAALIVGVWLFYDLPPVERVKSAQTEASIRILDRKGRLLYEFLPKETGRRQPVSLNDVPQDLVNATVATEDGRFFTNPGFDIGSIARSIWTSLSEGRIVSGGSTITQQVARMLLLSPQERNQRTIRRKLREISLAWLLTQHYSKSEILMLYLNNTYYGNLAYGINGAAETYFGKPVSELDTAECALLAGLAQAPEYYNPLAHSDRANDRKKVVLDLMAKQGFLSAEEKQAAEKETLQYNSSPYPVHALHFVLWVHDQLPALLSESVLNNPSGLDVQTTLDLDWQEFSEQAVSNQMQALEQNLDGINHNVHGMALVVIEPASGSIRAMVGSPNYFDSEHAGAINMALVPRQPGSALKPLIYAAALDPNQPQPWTAATMLLDVKTNFVTKKGESYTPTNYDQQEHGPVLVRQALGSSLNIPAIKTLQYVGLPRFIQFARSLGISTFDDPSHYDLSIALGGGDVTLLDLTTAYAAFANRGIRVDPYSIETITTGAGNVVYAHAVPEPVRVMDERVAWLISDILGDDSARAIGFGRDSLLQIDRPSAVKTGTTTNFHDNWTIGYTPNLIVGVWAGNTDQAPMWNATGITGAGPVWHTIIRGLLQGQPIDWFTTPPGMRQVEICSLSGMLPSPGCEYHSLEWFIDGTEPTAIDTLVKPIPSSGLPDLAVGDTVSGENPKDRIALDLPSDAIDWAHAHGYKLVSELSSSVFLEEDQTASTSSPTPLHITSPAAEAVFYLSKLYPVNIQKLSIQAAAGEIFDQVMFYVDGIEIARLDLPPYEAWWQLQVGVHEIWVEGSLSNREPVISNKVRIEVREDR
jgi:penicillin-binding protein 1C